MARKSFNFAFLFLLIISTVLLTGKTIRTANADGPGQEMSKREAPENNVQVPENLNNDKIHTFLATLSGAQVRRLLIQELKEDAAQELAGGGPEEEAGGLAGLVKKIYIIHDMIQGRLYELRSGAGADPEDLPKIYKLLAKDDLSLLWRT